MFFLRSLNQLIRYDNMIYSQRVNLTLLYSKIECHSKLEYIARTKRTG
nr:MAG TPA: hypothetical protein [Caudoviricetes sp.]